MSEAAKKILESARDLIKAPEAWTQGRFATDKDGNQTVPEMDDAVCFCSMGAIRKVLHANDYGIADIALALASLDRFTWGVVDYNDSHTHKEVIGKFNQAIKSLEQK